MLVLGQGPARAEEMRNNSRKMMFDEECPSLGWFTSAYSPRHQNAKFFARDLFVAAYIEGECLWDMVYPSKPTDKANPEKVLDRPGHFGCLSSRFRSEWF